MSPSCLRLCTRSCEKTAKKLNCPWKTVICQERPFHDNFVTLAKYSCHFLVLLTNGVIVVARPDKGLIGKLTFAYTLLFVWLASYEE
jgi:hypothetical protein